MGQIKYSKTRSSLLSQSPKSANRTRDNHLTFPKNTLERTVIYAHFENEIST
jgi:hypothetical protein